MKQYHNDFLLHLSSTDPVLHKVVIENGVIILPTKHTPFSHLIRIIAGQQLSLKAAETIYSRVESHLGKGYSPQEVLSCTEHELRELGLSNSKVKYMQAVAEAAGPDCINFIDMHKMSNDEVIKQLTEIKGIGVWSAQMFLMFQLQRKDVFAPCDLGLKKAMSLHYGYPMEGSEKLWSERAEKWSPFRTLASLHLWKSLE